MRSKTLSERKSDKPMEITPEERKGAIDLVMKNTEGKGSVFLIGAKREEDGIKFDWISLNLRPPDLLAICESILRETAADLGVPPAQLAFRIMLHCSEEKGKPS
jgi:hypothetical protein